VNAFSAFILNVILRCFTGHQNTVSVFIWILPNGELVLNNLRE